MNLLIVFLFLWFISAAKQMFFWLYLWQLKEYHIGRFLDHFSTDKGKHIFFNPVFGMKMFLLPLLFFFPFAWGAVALFYLIEAIRGAIQAYYKTLLLPAFTKKVIALAGAGFFLLASFMLFAGFERQPRDIFVFLLLFDIISPLIFSSLVLLFQPFAVLERRRIIERAKKKRNQFPLLQVVGITGSYGKTSTKEFLAHILSKRFRVLKTKEHRNSEVGISQTIFEELKPEYEVFVCEMGAYNRGGITLLANIAKPRAAILTGANEQHLATFGSMENLLAAEGGKELLEALPRDGIAVFNGNNKYTKELYESTNFQRKVLCGKDVVTEKRIVERKKISFELVSQGERVSVTANILGGYNVENLLLAIAMAKEMGMSLQEIVSVVATIPQELGAMKLRKGIHGLNIIDSTYSANPDGVIADLEYLKVWPGKKILVMPCLIELGRASKEVHRRIGKKIAEVCDLAILTTRDRIQDIKEVAGEKAVFMENPKDITERIRSFRRQGDIILLEGRVPSSLLSEILL